MNATITQARSGIAAENLQEILDAATSAAHATDVGQQQYESPAWLAAGLVSQLPNSSPAFALDPQCASGNLLSELPYAGRYGWDIDNRFAERDEHNIHRITGNCVKLAAILDDLYPDLRFPCIVSNPPFAIRWKQADGTTIDSTLWTWNFIKAHLALHGAGFLISSWSTIERMKLHEDPWCYLYQKFPAGIWPNTVVEIGVVHFYNFGEGAAPFTRRDHVWPSLPEPSEFYYVRNPFTSRNPEWRLRPDQEWQTIGEAWKEEHGHKPKWNIYLDKRGILRTYLSTKAKVKFQRDDVLRLAKIDDCHPLTLTTERESRKVLYALLERGVYQIEPRAEEAIKDALKQVESLACPIMPITDFELTAYSEDEDYLCCKATDPNDLIALTPGKKYEITTGSYTFKEKFTRKKLHFDEETEKTELVQHDCELSGSDRFIQIVDDRGGKHRFMERPNPHARSPHYSEHPESALWQLFKEPYVRTIAESNEEQYEKNLSVMRLYSTINGFKYFDGQLDYAARMACKDYGVIGADVGVGKTAIALTMVALKNAGRSLIIAPQGTMRSSEDEEGEEYRASQWVQEIQKFAASEPVFQLFNEADLEAILNANGGKLPAGIYITYPQAYFSNGAFEFIPQAWDDEEEHEEKFCKRLGLPFDEDRDSSEWFCRGVGTHDKETGIRCVAHPSLATKIACRFGEPWDMVILDEGHLCFPYATMVETKEYGPMEIGEIVDRELDVSVLSCDLNKNVTEWKRVTGWFRNPATRPLVRVTHEGGSFICTDDHKIRVGNGWRRAKTLVRGDEVHVVWDSLHGTKEREAYPKVLRPELCQPLHELGSSAEGYNFGAEQERANHAHEGLCSMREGVRIQTGFSVRSPEEVLHQGMFGLVEEGEREAVATCTGKALEILGQSSRHQESGVIRTHEAEKPNEEPGVRGEDASEAGRSNISIPRWERETDTPAIEPTESVGTSGFCTRVCDTNKGSAREIRESSELLQGGHRIPGTETGDRGGRGESQAQEVEVLGSTERSGLGMSRVVCVEVLQPRGGIANANGIGADNVYCLEVEDNHNFFAEGVLVSNCCNEDAQITRNLIRLQPKYRYIMTATPISNIVTNLFTLMGWCCVPDWYLGGRRNAAWPYSVEDSHRFASTFLSTEVDVTAQSEARAAGKKGWRNVGVKTSPIISSPARLLKLLKPSMAYISKEKCNPNLQPCEVIDVRVDMGAQQAKLYQHWLNRAAYVNEYKHPLVIARVQSSRLRGICAAPVGLDYNRYNSGDGMRSVRSNFNPKVGTILELAHQCLAKGEQVVIVSSRVSLSNELARRLSEAGVEIARIDNTVPADMHTAEANRFKKGDARVMLMGIKCAQGHSFHLCPNLIVGALEWSYGTLHQAKGRVWRLNSVKPVKIWIVLIKGSIEELLFDRVATKQDAATLCLHGKRVPRDFKTLDAGEVLAEHIVDYVPGKLVDENDLEDDWAELKRRLELVSAAHRA